MVETAAGLFRSRRDMLMLGVFLALSFVVFVAGGLVTAGSVTTWYPTLIKPSFNPPDWAFGPVWTVLYIFMAIAGWRVWRFSDGAARSKALRLFGLQLALNCAWSFLFFGAQWIGIALLEIVALLLAVVATTVLFWRIDRVAGWLFVPYIVWVAYASTLNTALWVLNPS